MSAMSPFELRASSAYRWVKCTAYNRMSQGMPDIADPVVREEGTAFHWAALMVWLGHAVPVGTRAPNGVEVDEDMVDAIDQYIDGIRAWGGVARLEMSVGAPRIHPRCGGTVDAWSWSPLTNILDVGDAKYGYRFVSPFENWQMLVYVCGLLDYLGITEYSRVMVRMHIYQPRAYRRDGPWFSWSARASDLASYFLTLHNAAYAALGPSPTCHSGEWCSNCNARVTCDAFHEAVENALEVCREPVNNDTNGKRVNDELLRVERAMEILDARRSGLEAYAEMYMRGGEQLRHYNLESGRSRLHWKPGVLPALTALGGAQMFNQKPITPTQAKKVIDPELVDALSERYAGKLKVVRVQADRAARVFGASNNGTE